MDPGPRDATLPTVVYVINSFNRGGAESGLLELVDGGMFAQCRLKIVALVRGEGGVDAALATRGYAPEILVDLPRMRSWDLPLIFLRLWRVVRRTRPQIVIGSLPQANLFARLCVALRTHITFVSFEHNTHLAKKAYEIGFRLTSWRVDWMLADSRTTLETAAERLYRWRPANRAVVPLVSFASSANTRYRRDASEPFRVVNAGRFTTVKNQGALIAAVALLTERGADVVLTLYGDGPERAACERLATELRIQDRVRFAGFVRDWAARPADLFVLASRHEGLCIVALEAMHAGIPVAAPAVGGLRDYVSPDVAYIIDSVDARCIADVIARAMESELDSQMIVAAAAKVIDERFSAAAVGRIYREVGRVLARSTLRYASANDGHGRNPVLGDVGRPRP
jgi:glycosyltransferase involved in cell wall biosynthesis